MGKLPDSRKKIFPTRYHPPRKKADSNLPHIRKHQKKKVFFGVAEKKIFFFPERSEEERSEATVVGPSEARFNGAKRRPLARAKRVFTERSDGRDVGAYERDVFGL